MSLGTCAGLPFLGAQQRRAHIQAVFLDTRTEAPSALQTQEPLWRNVGCFVGKVYHKYYMLQQNCLWDSSLHHVSFAKWEKFGMMNARVQIKPTM